MTLWIVFLGVVLVASVVDVVAVYRRERDAEERRRQALVRRIWRGDV